MGLLRIDYVPSNRIRTQGFALSVRLVAIKEYVEIRNIQWNGVAEAGHRAAWLRKMAKVKARI